MDSNFPVVYAVIPYNFKSVNGHYLHAGYVASKVYLVGEQIDYYPNSRISTKYKIIRPYRYQEDFDNRRTPKFSKTSSNLYLEVKVVTKIYESFEEASQTAKQQSEEFWQKVTCPIRLILNKDDWKLILSEYEKSLMLLTQDMKVQKSQTKSLIIKNGGK